MTRYTYKSLDADLTELNKSLDKLGAEFRPQIGSAYNRTHINLATPEQMARHCCHRQLYSGTPRECLAKAEAYALQCFITANSPQPLN